MQCKQKQQNFLPDLGISKHLIAVSTVLHSMKFWRHNPGFVKKKSCPFVYRGKSVMYKLSQPKFICIKIHTNLDHD